MIDSTEQPLPDPNSQPYIEPVLAPPPPAPKPPTLASMIVDELRAHDDTWHALNWLYERLGSLKVLAYVAIGIAVASVALNIAVLAILAALLGHAR